MFRFAAVALIASALPALADDCEMEDFTAETRGSNIYVSAAMTCEAGRMDYRLYEGERFLGSGFTYFRGYAAQFYSRGAMPESLTVRYVITPTAVR